MLTAAQIQQMADIIVERFHPEKIILFGSHVRGDAAEDSDVDLLVIDDCEPAQCRQVAINIRIALRNRPSPIDVLVSTPTQFEKGRKQFWNVLSHADKEGRLLYG